MDVSAFAGANGNRTLQQMISQMVSSKTNVTEDESDQSAADVGAATKLAGFAVQLSDSRKDSPKITVLGGHAVDMAVDRGKLQMIFDEAGRRDLTVPASLDGAPVENCELHDRCGRNTETVRWRRIPSGHKSRDLRHLRLITVIAWC